MRIAMTTDSFVEGKGGVATAIANLARALRARGHQVKIFSARDPSHLQSDLDVMGVRAFYYQRFPGGRIPIDPQKLVNALAQFKPDIIHNHSMSAMGIQALAAGQILDIPIIGTCHVYLAGFLNYSPIPMEGIPLAEKIAWQYTAQFFNRFRYVTTPSETMKEKLIKAGLRRPISTISNGVDTHHFIPPLSFFNLTYHPPTIIHVGRLGYEKKVDFILKIFNLIAPKFPQTRLLIIGDGPQKTYLQSLAKDFGIGTQVEFTGQVSHQQLVHYYQQSDIFVTASPIETQGLVVLEAMSCGLPIIGVNAMALTELIDPGVNGYLIEPGDEQGFSETIAHLLQSSHLCETMGKASRQLALQHNIHIIAEKYEKLYFMVCEKYQPAWFSYPKLTLALQEVGTKQFPALLKTIKGSSHFLFKPSLLWGRQRKP